MTSTSGWFWDKSTFTIKLASQPEYCLNAQGGLKEGVPLILYPCEPLTSNMQFVTNSDGTIQFRDLGGVGFNVQGGISGNPNNRKIQTFSNTAANNEVFFMASLPPDTDTEAVAVLIKPSYLCKNRGSVGGTGGYSIAANSLNECVASVASNPNCGTQFSWSTIQKWCDCPPATAGPCTFYTDTNTANGEYNIYALTPYFYIKWDNSLCLNRGGVGGSNVYSVNKPNVQQCAVSVASNPACGNEFSFGKKDGWCDCVPKGRGPCTFYRDSGTQQNAEAVYTIPANPSPTR